MKILGFQKLSLTDYDGFLCCTIFLFGCNMLCPFCHNKDLVIKNPKTKEINLEEILDYLNKNRGKIEAVCITGGEPTVNPDLAILLKKIKELGFLIKLDTNGTNPGLLETLINEKLIDYVAIDFKNSLNLYPQTIGLNKFNHLSLLNSIALLKENKIKYELRTTLVKELHTEVSIMEMAQTLSGENILFLQKFVDSGNCLQEGLHPISYEEALKFKKILEKEIKTVKLRGY